MLQQNIKGIGLRGVLPVKALAAHLTTVQCSGILHLGVIDPHDLDLAKHFVHRSTLPLRMFRPPAFNFLENGTVSQHGGLDSTALLHIVSC